MKRIFQKGWFNHHSYSCVCVCVKSWDLLFPLIIRFPNKPEPEGLGRTFSSFFSRSGYGCKLYPIQNPIESLSTIVSINWLQFGTLTTPPPLTVEIPICYSTGEVFVAGLLRFFWFKSLLLGLCVAWWVAGRCFFNSSPGATPIMIGPNGSVHITSIYDIYDGDSKMIFPIFSNRLKNSKPFGIYLFLGDVHEFTLTSS